MARYLARQCPKCGGYMGIVIREPKRKVRAQGINGLCVQCGHRLAWISIAGKQVAPKSKLLFYGGR